MGTARVLGALSLLMATVISGGKCFIQFREKAGIYQERCSLREIKVVDFDYSVHLSATCLEFYLISFSVRYMVRYIVRYIVRYRAVVSKQSTIVSYWQRPTVSQLQSSFRASAL